jgi:hypothetical protein
MWPNSVRRALHLSRKLEAQLTTGTILAPCNFFPLAVSVWSTPVVAVDPPTQAALIEYLETMSAYIAELDLPSNSLSNKTRMFFFLVVFVSV